MQAYFCGRSGSIRRCRQKKRFDMELKLAPDVQFLLHHILRDIPAVW